MLEEIDEKAVVEYYLQPHGIKPTCKKFHIGEKRLKDILFKNNITTHRVGGFQKYHWDKDFFNPGNPDFAYFLGIMGADGCIANNSNQIYLELQQQDKEILERIRQRMNLSRPVKDYITKTGYKNSKLYIEDKELKYQLINMYHLVPNKTYNHKDFKTPFDTIPKENWKDYVRGYFDGDGSIKNSNHTLTFQIDGSNFNVLNDIQSFLEQELQINICIDTRVPGEGAEGHKHKIPLYRIYCYGENAKRIFQLLYKDSPKLFLQRKYDKYIQLLNTIYKGE